MADASSSELGASFSGSFLADKTDNEGELNLQEDSDDDSNDCSNALHNYFSDNDDLEESFLGFSSSDDSGHSWNFGRWPKQFSCWASVWW